MITRTRSSLPPAPPPAIMAELRRRFPARELRPLEAMIALRTASQQADNALIGWLEDIAGSPSRLHIMVLLLAAKGRTVPHKEIIAALRVTRATVSGLMAGLEREGLVRSSTDRDDRRQLLASLTPKGEAVIGEALDVNSARLRAVFHVLSATELKRFTAMLQRVREAFVAVGNKRLTNGAGDWRASQKGRCPPGVVR